jgi:abortive infection bacteriophage resistance protein
MTKKHISFKEQIELLQSRNLTISNINTALTFLNHVSYYRFNSYRFPYFNKKINLYSNVTTLEDVINLYQKDTYYKSLIYIILENIEIAFRTQLIYHFSKNDPLFYCHKKNYTPTSLQKTKNQKITNQKINDLLEKVKNHIKNTNNIHIYYHKQKHDEISKCKKTYKECNKINCYPAAWIAIESFEFGTLLDVYSLVNDDFSNHKVSLNNFFTLNLKLPLQGSDLPRLLQDIKRLRNIIAHHDKILDRYTFKKSESIGLLNKLYNNNTNLLDLLKKEDAKASFLPYYLVLKYFIDLFFNKQFILNDLNNQQIQYPFKEFLDFTQQNKIYLNLSELENSFFNPLPS